MAPVRALARVVLVLALAASTQGLLFAKASFEVNREWIAETLCVNRDRPELECDGHCVLMERMEAHHDHDDGPDPGVVLEVALSITPLLAERPGLADPVGQAPRPYGAGPLVGAASGAGEGVFRPPRGV